MQEFTIGNYESGGSCTFVLDMLVTDDEVIPKHETEAGTPNPRTHELSNAPVESLKTIYGRLFSPSDPYAIIV